MRYARNDTEALQPTRLRAVTKHLHDNRDRGSSANKGIQPLSRMFRLARVRWGLTTHKPCEAIEYLPESPRDQYVSDTKYSGIYEAASPILRYTLKISTQTGGRVGMIFDIQLQDFNEQQLELRVTKKRNERGHVSKRYLMTPDLWRALTAAIELRKANHRGAASLPSDYLFITKQGNPYSTE